jgi:hypothetical protein
MNDERLLEISNDTDDFINKMMLHHKLDFASVAGVMLARMAKLSMLGSMEEGLLQLMHHVKTSLQDSINDRDVH